MEITDYRYVVAESTFDFNQFLKSFFAQANKEKWKIMHVCYANSGEIFSALIVYKKFEGQVCGC